MSALPPETPAYHLGCPFWGGKAWSGRLFTSRARQADYLGQYAVAFSAVEGNTTFYGVPAPATVEAWAGATPESFRFLAKLPREISHDAGLRAVGEATRRFIGAMQPLGPRAIFWLQLPPWFDDLGTLRRWLAAWPLELPLVVEPRHPSLFDDGDDEATFDELLREAGADRVLFDTRELHAIASHDEALRDARRRKPDLPRRMTALGARPVLRYIGDPAAGEADQRALAMWAEQVAAWIDEGRQPLVFMHEAPSDEGAPELCRRFHELVRQQLPRLPELPRWPGEREPRQLTLFEGM